MQFRSMAVLAGAVVCVSVSQLATAEEVKTTNLRDEVVDPGAFGERRVQPDPRLGGLTHPVLDGLMHDDVSPLMPFSAANPLLGLVSYPAIAACLLAMRRQGPHSLLHAFGCPLASATDDGGNSWLPRNH